MDVGAKHTPMEELAVFQEFVQVADRIWDSVLGWDRLAQDTVGKQLIRAADSVGANLVEGDGRFAKGDGIHFLIIARGSARETCYWIERAQNRNLLSQEDASEQINALTHATRLLNGIITYRRAKLAPAQLKENPEAYQIYQD